MVYGIHSLFQEHSPGGSTVLLCQIHYVFHTSAGWGSEMRLPWGLIGCVRGREKVFSMQCAGSAHSRVEH